MSEGGKKLGEDYLRVSISDFRRMKRLAEKAMDQLEDDDYHQTADPEANSVAVLIRHLSGNMLSRWTDFLTTDGEKESRKRDTEFVDEGERPDALRERWERGWSCLFEALGNLGAEDLTRTVHIRSEAHTVVEAISRQMWHYGSHVGQIIYIAKHRRAADWATLSIPRGKSEEYFRKPRF